MFDQYQIAHDIARFYNMIHDGVDACRWICHGVQPDNGEPIEEVHSEVLNILRSVSLAAKTNYGAVVTYANAVGIQTAKDAVAAVFGIDASTLIDRLQDLNTYANYIYNNCLNWTEEDLQTAASYLDANVPKWKSIRRRWALNG